MIAPYALALDQLATDRRLRRVLWLGIGLSLLVLVLLVAGIWALLVGTEIVTVGWIDVAIDWLGILAAPLLAWILFPVTVVAVTGLLLDRVVEAVEGRHYPNLPPPRPQGLAQGMLASLRLVALAVLLNLLALPIYFFVPVVGQVAFYVVNGYLVGREFFETVALRRLDPRRARLLRRALRGRIFLHGVAMALFLTIPVVNLAVPVVAAAVMTHVFHRVRSS